MEIKLRDIARLYPEFVQWVVQTKGPMESVTETEYTALAKEYEESK